MFSRTQRESTLQGANWSTAIVKHVSPCDKSRTILEPFQVLLPVHTASESKLKNTRAPVRALGYRALCFSVLSAKHKRFAEEYSVDHNATAAAIRAGYAESRARQTGSEMLGPTPTTRNVSDESPVTYRQPSSHPYRGRFGRNRKQRVSTESS